MANGLDADDPGAYPPFAVTVDVALFTVRRARLHVLLVERAEQPFKGEWALRGGFVKIDEDLPEAAARELAEAGGRRVDRTEQVDLGEPGKGR